MPNDKLEDVRNKLKLASDVFEKPSIQTAGKAEGEAYYSFFSLYTNFADIASGNMVIRRPAREAFQKALGTLQQYNVDIANELVQAIEGCDVPNLKSLLGKNRDVAAIRV